MVVALVAVVVAAPDEAGTVVVELLNRVEEGAEVTVELSAVETVTEEAVETVEEAAEETAVEVAVGAQVAVVGKRSAFPTDPQMAFANLMVAVKVVISDHVANDRDWTS